MLKRFGGKRSSISFMNHVFLLKWATYECVRSSCLSQDALDRRKVLLTMLNRLGLLQPALVNSQHARIVAMIADYSLCGRSIARKVLALPCHQATRSSYGLHAVMWLSLAVGLFHGSLVYVLELNQLHEPRSHRVWTSRHRLVPLLYCPDSCSWACSRASRLARSQTRHLNLRKRHCIDPQA
jgi:hypothetical protein